MKHISDGDLHAYLDGALELYPHEDADRIRRHLDQCEACRDRLVEEGALRDDAKAVLDAGAPGQVALPPLEELRRRAEASPSAAPARGGFRHRLRAVGWAASVVLAVGLGWYAGREPLDAPTGAGNAAATGPQVARSDGVAETPEPVAAEALMAAAQEEEAQEDAVDSEMAALEVPTGVALDVRVEPLPVEDVLAPPRPAPAAPASDVEAAPTVADPTALGPEVLRARVAEGRTMERAGEPMRLPVITDSLAANAADSVSSAPARQVTALMQRAPGRALVLPDLGSRSSQGVGEESDEPPPGDTAGMRESASAPLQLPGLDVVHTEIGWVVPGVSAIRVVQQIPGDTAQIEVFFGGVGATADEGAGRVPQAILEASLPQGVRQVTRALDGGGWVVLRGRIGEEGLRSLLRLLG